MVIWCQVFLYNTNNLQTDLFDGALIGTTTLGQSGPGSNDNEVALHIPQRSGTKASLLDAA